ncbi:MAG: hypothetical protein NVS9B3_13040 [Gemmatimonadaceae bacterium]
MTTIGDLVFGSHALAKTFRAGVAGCSLTARALCGVSLVLRRGEVTVLSGPAGGGKTTLLLCAAGLLRPDAGRVWWCDGARSAAYLSCSGTERVTPLLVGALARDPSLMLCDGLPRVGTSDDATVRHLLDRACRNGVAVAVAVREGPSLRDWGSSHLLLESGRVVGQRRAPSLRSSAEHRSARRIAELSP